MLFFYSPNKFQFILSFDAKTLKDENGMQYETLMFFDPQWDNTGKHLMLEPLQQYTTEFASRLNEYVEKHQEKNSCICQTKKNLASLDQDEFFVFFLVMSIYQIRNWLLLRRTLKGGMETIQVISLPMCI